MGVKIRKADIKPIKDIDKTRPEVKKRIRRVN